MKKCRCADEIAHLSENQINLKVPKVDGYLIKKNKLSWQLENYYQRSKKLKKICPRSGLNYCYFFESTESVLYVFTNCPPFLLPGDSRNFIIITVYEWPEDFMASKLAAYYRNKYCYGDPTNSWDSYGYFVTKCSKYNNVPIVNAISKLRRNQTMKRSAPIDRIKIGLEAYLFV